MVFTQNNTPAQATNMAQNAQQAANSSGNGSGNVDAPLVPIQVRDAFSRDVDGHSQFGDGPADNAVPVNRDVEVEDNIQAFEENEAADTPASVLFVVHSRTKKLVDGFQPVSPPDEGKPHVFTQHKVRDADWAKFLSDLQDAARLIDVPYTPALSSLPGLFSTLNLDEGVQGNTTAASAARDYVHPTMVISLWNEHYFNPRGLDIVLAKGPHSLSGDVTSPPPDFSEPSAPFDRGMYGPHFHQHPFPHPPTMQAPHMPFMSHLPPPHAMPMHGMGPGSFFQGMPGFDQPPAGFGPMNHRGGHEGRGGRGGPGGRGRGFGHPFGGRGGFSRGMHGPTPGMGGRGGFGMRGRGGGHPRGGFPHFGHHQHPTPFDGNDDFVPSEDYEMTGFEDIGLPELAGAFGPGHRSRSRSHSVCSISSDTSTSTMSSSDDKKEEANEQEKAKGSDDAPRRKHSGRHHRRRGHSHAHRRGEATAEDERSSHRHRHHHHHRRGCADARLAHRLASRRGGFDGMGHGFGMRGGMRGHGHGFPNEGHHGRHHPFNGRFADDGYYRLIVVDQST